MDCNIFIPKDWSIEIVKGYVLSKIVFKGENALVALQLPNEMLEKIVELGEKALKEEGQAIVSEKEIVKPNSLTPKRERESYSARSRK